MRMLTLGRVSIAFGKRRIKVPKIAPQKSPMQTIIHLKAHTMTPMRNSLLLPCILTRTVPTDSNSNFYRIPLIREFPTIVFSNKIQCLTSYSMTFDPNFPMIAGMRYPPPIPGPIPGMPLSPDESQEVHGNVDWRLAWVKEIGHLQQITEEQEKAGADPEWYRMMLYRVRNALMPPPMNPEVMHAMAAPHMQPPQPNGGEIPQQQQVQQ
jgi:hypothetical protein